jgi:hypothetical protein
VLSIREILFTAVVVVIIWLAFGWIRRAQELRASRGATVKSAAARKGIVEDMIACPVCGAYGTPDAGACGRPDCQRS